MIQAVHILVAIFLSLGILLQSRASGLSATFGGSGSSLQIQRRGAEKLIYKGTIVLSIIFFALSLIRWFI